MEIILASHMTLAKGMKESLEFILGPLPNVRVMTAYTTDKYDIESEINQLLQNTERAIVITDLLGGSVNTAWVTYVYKNNLSDRIKVITGMNLNLVLEICSNVNDNDFLNNTNINNYIESSKRAIVNCNNILGGIND
ncbi:hypothetical protein [Anaerococcus sp. Marseille-Q7828]|uniref:PTS sugar transporter subunit IIA n=1 Tax=Anaerococcus sp. Marseille-Q7828 TaxID=3036300 RepID=UPI0024ADD521|nr:hypothetical protein [Anaerococcus sp. Marseille-Q7828]